MSLKISNAACPLGEKYGDLLKLEKSQFDRILTKTCTLSPIKFPDQPLYDSKPLYSLNNFGLGNIGYREYSLYQFPEKPFTISVTGTFKEIRQITGIPTRADYLEFNVSCPNSTKEVLSIGDLARIKHQIPFGVKLPPYFDLRDIEKMAEKLNKMARTRKEFSYVVCCNTIPFEGVGGIGGPLLKPVSLYNIGYFRKLLPPKIEVWGCGGIREVDDLLEYEAAGASGVQIGTVAIDKGLEYTDELVQIYRNLDLKAAI